MFASALMMCRSIFGQNRCLELEGKLASSFSSETLVSSSPDGPLVLYDVVQEADEEVGR